MTIEIDVEFCSFEAWSQWSARHPECFQADWIDDLGHRILSQGLREPLTGLIAVPDALEGGGPNWREGLRHLGVNSRMRAVLKVVADLPAMPDRARTHLFAPEALSPFAERLRDLYPHFRGSEFSDDPAIRASFGTIPHEDLCRLSMRSATCDLVVTNDVLEHVADLDAALGEIARVLRPGGWHVGTHPFRPSDRQSLVRARIEGGQVHHLLEPEYHGDPVNPDGALVFEVPGWDILQRCRNAGFGRAAMRLVLSEAHGCLSPHVGGVFVLVAQK